MSVEKFLPLEGCDASWEEQMPKPVELPEALQEVAGWITSHRIPIDPRKRIGELIFETWRGHFMPHRLEKSELPSLAALSDPKTVRRYFPHKVQERALMRDLRGVLRPHAFLPAYRAATMSVRQALAKQTHRSELGEALLKVLEAELTPKLGEEPVYCSYAAGLETDAPVYRFVEVNDRAYYCDQTQVFRIGLWPDLPEEMLLSCSCGGCFDKPCRHFYLGIERLLESIARTNRPGHRELLERLSKPIWHTTLSALTQSSAFSVEPPDTPEAAAERVAWRVERLSDRFVLTPYIQSMKRNGVWSKGRRVDTDRLEENHSALMTEWDAPAAVAAHGGALNWFRALVSHPLVFDGEPPHRPIRVTEAPLMPALVAEGDSIRLGFRFGGVHRTAGEIRRVTDDKNGVVALTDRRAGRLYFTQLEPMHREVLDTLLNRPSRLPVSQLSALIEVLVRSPDAVPVYIDPVFRKASALPNLRPVLRLTPSGDAGLLLEIGFHLFSDAHWSVPGEGAEYLLRGICGVPTGLLRTFSKERAEASRIVDALRGMGFTTFRNFCFLTGAVDDTAALLSAVRGLEVPHDVEWAKGVTPWTVNDLLPRNVHVAISGGKGAMFRIGIDAVMDDLELDHRMLMDALSTGTKYIAIGPGRFARIEEGLRAAIEAVDAANIGKDKQGAEVSVPAALSLREQLDALDAQISADESWQQLVEKLERASTWKPPVPRSLNGTLREYQQEGYRWLCRQKASGFGACLADDMGLGKTVEALALLLQTRSDLPSLVVAPTSVAPNWVRETERFAPSLFVRLHHGAERETELRDLTGDDLVVTTYEILVRDAALFTSLEFETVVIDEAQMVKNALTKRAKAVCALRAETKIALTGTPLENHLGELWSIFHIIAPGLLGSARQFQRSYIVPIQRDRMRAPLQLLSLLIRPFVLRRLKAEVAPELPPRTETVRLVELYTEERKQYEAARMAALRHLKTKNTDADASRLKFHALAHLTKLRRMVCHPRLADPASLTESAKLDAAEELIQDILQGGGRALVFSQFTGHLALLRERLDRLSLSYLYLDGSVPAARRGVLTDQWAAGLENLFLISLKAGGTGLNLTGADYVVHLDPWWNPAVEDQAADRTHRIGQTKPVTVVRLIAAATVEEAVTALHETKRDLAENLLQGTNTAEATSLETLLDLLSVQGGDRFQMRRGTERV